MKLHINLPRSTMANSNPKEPTPKPKKQTPSLKERTPSPKEPTPIPSSSAGPSAGPSAGISTGISPGTSTGTSTSNSADQKCPKIKKHKTLQSRMESMKEKNKMCQKIAKCLAIKLEDMQHKDTVHDLRNEAIYNMMRSDNFAEQVVHARSFIPNVSAIKHNMDYEETRRWVFELEGCLNEMSNI